MTQRCKKRLVKKYNTQSLHILRDHVRCAPAPRYNCPHLHFYFMLFCAPASHFTHPHLLHLSFPHPRSRRKVPNSAVWLCTAQFYILFRSFQTVNVSYPIFDQRGLPEGFKLLYKLIDVFIYFISFKTSTCTVHLITKIWYLYINYL